MVARTIIITLHNYEFDGASHVLIGGWRNKNKGTVILPIMGVCTNGGDSINVLWDTVANLSLITKQKANMMKLKGKPVKLSVKLAGGEKRLSNQKFILYRLLIPGDK